jgi:GNAT superfamily N-acetyltransferase
VSESDLHLQWLNSPDDVPEGLRRALTTCWRDVANAGGAVGFAEEVPVTEDVVAPVVDQIVAGLHPRRARLLVATRDDDLAGWLLLSGNADPVVAHWGRVTRLQTALDARGSGVGRALLTELHRSARDDLGLDSLRLEVRGGWGLEAFYERFGWQVVGTWPGALQFTEHGRRDEVLMALDLTRQRRVGASRRARRSSRGR